MAILITGGTGFIGKRLLPELRKVESTIYILSRSPKKAKRHLQEDYNYISNLDEISDSTKITGIINLAGAPIAKRWSQSYKKELLQSRLRVTQSCVDLIKRLDSKPKWFISGSAIGFYGSQHGLELSEESRPHPEFTHDLCLAWEKCALQAEDDARVCLARTGVVLGPKGGALKQMLPFFKLGLGGRIGSGTQWLSWIHIDDTVQIFIELIHNPLLSGPINVTSPFPVRNVEFTKALGKTLKRPTMFPLPNVAVGLLYGEMGLTLLANGQKVIPKKLLTHDFSFKYPKLDAALNNILAK